MANELMVENWVHLLLVIEGAVVIVKNEWEPSEKEEDGANEQN